MNAQIVRDMLDRLRWSPATLAEAAELAPSTVTRALSGDTKNPCVETLAAIVKVFSERDTREEPWTIERLMAKPGGQQ